VTANDSGGTLEFVKNNINGFICAPEAEVIGATINKLANNKSQAVALGEAGYEEARKITWDGVIERLVENEDTRS
jgi:glycosyltransferase involved in cell wall biosynthesis